LELGEVLFSLSRRHALPFAVLALRAHPNVATSLESRRAGFERLIPDALRTTDVVIRWEEGQGWIVFCPSTTSEGSKELAQRIRTRAEDWTIAHGSASFRKDALTLPDLIEYAWADLEAVHGAGSGSVPPEDSASTGHGGPRRARRPTLRSRVSAGLKRSFDVGAVVASAPLWVPLALLCAAAIKLSDRSAPALFRQERTGRGGRRFEMLKFRTMVPNAEELKEEVARLNLLAWPDFKVVDDPRVTRLGRILRKTSLDEIPQLLNVLRGEMSLVGPRPTSFAPEVYQDWHTARLDVIPGITGLWQVEGRAKTEFDERLRLDLQYVRRQGFLYDLSILLRTVLVVFTARGGH
jgi:lipopolysaccharide/colanic/teichoic acid biosynthesis glycosyltransferase